MSDSELDDEYQESDRPSRYRNADHAGSSQEPARMLSPSELAAERERKLRQMEQERERAQAHERLRQQRRELIYQHMQAAALAGDAAPPSPFLVPDARRAHFVTARRLLDLLPVIEPRAQRAYAATLDEGNDMPMIQTISNHISNGVLSAFESIEVNWSSEEVVTIAGVMLTGCLVAPSLLPGRALHRVMMHARPQHVHLLASLTSVASRQAGEIVDDNMASVHVLLELADAASGGPTPSLLLGALLVHHALSIVVPEYTADFNLSQPLSDDELYLMLDLARTTDLEVEISEMVENLAKYGLKISKLSWVAQRPGIHLCWRDRQPLWSGYQWQTSAAALPQSAEELNMDLDAELVEMMAASVHVAVCASPSPSPSSSPSPPQSPPQSPPRSPPPPPSLSMPQPPTPPPLPLPLMPFASKSPSNRSQLSGSRSTSDPQLIPSSTAYPRLTGFSLHIDSGTSNSLPVGFRMSYLQPGTFETSYSLPTRVETSDSRPSQSETRYSRPSGSGSISSNSSESGMSSLRSNGSGMSYLLPSGSLASRSESDDDDDAEDWWAVVKDRLHGIGSKRPLNGED